MLRKFILKTSFFLIPLVIFWIYLEVGLHFVPTSYSKVKRLFESRKSDIEVLVIGNSETQLGVAPKFFQNQQSHNLSNVAQTLYTSVELIKMNLNEMKNLKLVMLGISPWTFMINDGSRNEEWREKFYYHFWDIIPEKNEPIFLWKLRTGIYDYQTMFNYALKGFQGIPTPYIDAIDTTGWERGYIKNSDELLNDEVGQLLASIHFKNIVYTYNFDHINYITDLNKTLQKKGIKLILIQVPKSKYYLNHLSEQLFVKNKIVFDSLTKNLNIPAYSFLNDSCFIDEDFRDVNHLNYIGAEKFSKMLSQIIDKNLP